MRRLIAFGNQSSPKTLIESHLRWPQLRPAEDSMKASFNCVLGEYRASLAPANYQPPSYTITHP